MEDNMRNDQQPRNRKMDVYTTLCCGCLLAAGGLIALVSSIYGCFTFVNGAFSITEVLISGCVFVLGVYLMVRSLPKFINMMGAENSCETPFYYELEPVSPRRDLPPVPRDIGRDYDPVVLDKV